MTVTAKMNTNANTLQQPEGFTLIEVFIAMLVLMIALLGMAGMAGTVIQANVFSRNMTAATSLAEEKIEELINTPPLNPNQLLDESDPDNPVEVGNYEFTREWRVWPRVDGVRRVRVTVTFSWRDTDRNVVLETYIR